MFGLWSLRLAWHLARRIRAAHPQEDGRYRELRRRWATALELRFFVFFQAQGLFGLLLSLPAFLASQDPAPALRSSEWWALALWAGALAGESLADLQMARFKADPARAGQVCDRGLWRFSRHPNYFFEWLIWCAYALFAWGAPWGSLALMGPLLMLYTLLRVTGLPATEEQALRSKGEAYLAYRRRTSAFVPWFPRGR